MTRDPMALLLATGWVQHLPGVWHHPETNGNVSTVSGLLINAGPMSPDEARAFADIADANPPRPVLRCGAGWR